MSDFLFELGVEEVPVSEIKPILGQLKTKFQYYLKENQIEFRSLETAATNKRFMLYFNNINAKALDREEQIKGPAVRIAYNDHKQPTVALQKFIEFNQVDPSELKEIDTPKGAYIVIDKKTPGLPTVEILKQIIPLIFKELTFSKAMVWNYSRLPFIRPIKNILALFDNQLIPVTYAGIHASSLTYGHTLLSDTPIEVKSFRAYNELLHKNFVIVREDERKNKIAGEIKEIEEEFKVHIPIDSRMLDDYVYNNEYPVVFYGRFDKKYLELPAEIISTFMIKEKKLIPVFSKENKLINMFVGVSNIPDENQYVKTGNERVIRATFEDAKFFWDNDREDDFIELREQLKNVTFHKDLGTFYEKTDRLYKLVNFLVKETRTPDLQRPLQIAALYCKNDLVTRMVREFPSLQGIMGGVYLKEKGDAEDTWGAVYYHYEPKGFHTAPLEHQGAAILSMADKIDNITAFLSKDIKISSSKDPYGIRRDANAIIKIILDFAFDFNLDTLIRFSASLFAKDDTSLNDLLQRIRELFQGRLDNIFKEFLNFRYDVVNAVLMGNPLCIYRMYRSIQELLKIVETESASHLIALHRRLKNIVKKSDLFTVSEDLLVDKEEKILYDIFKTSASKIEDSISNNQYLQACSEILEMKPLIDDFFEKILVMAEDKKLRENRIALVQQLDMLLSRIADFSLLVEEKQ